MGMTSGGNDDADRDMTADDLSADERAAARAFIARCEVRLSTFHRIAVGLLSGAGILVVLPVVAKDSISGLLRSLAIGEFTPTDAALMVMVITVLAVPAVALWLLFTDLTRFYFHANHIGDGRDTFTPRFTLTSLRLPSDELGPAAAAQLDRSRHDAHIVELLVPTNDASRARIDRQLDAYHPRPSTEVRDDRERSDGLFELAASRPRPLLEEVAKIEYGMARHGLRLRSLVLRYVKAVLAVLAAAVAVYAGDAVVTELEPGRGVTTAAAVWLAAIGLAWAPAVVLAVTSPVRWVEQLMRDDGAPTNAVSNDPELTHIERTALRIAAVGWLASILAMVLAVTDDVTSTTRALGLAVTGASFLAVGVAVATGRLRSSIASPNTPRNTRGR